MSKMNLNVVIFQEKAGEETYLVAQCLEHDIAVQAKSLRQLEDRFMVALVGQIVVDVEHNQKPLAHVPSAPARFFEMYRTARKFADPLQVPFPPGLSVPPAQAELAMVA